MHAKHAVASISIYFQYKPKVSCSTLFIKLCSTSFEGRIRSFLGGTSSQNDQKQSELQQNFPKKSLL